MTPRAVMTTPLGAKQLALATKRRQLDATMIRSCLCRPKQLFSHTSQILVRVICVAARQEAVCFVPLDWWVIVDQPVQQGSCPIEFRGNNSKSPIR